MKQHDNLIAGRSTPPRTGKYSKNFNPADVSEILGEFALSDSEDVSQAIEEASRAFPRWAATPGPERGRILYRFADLLERHKDELAEILTKEEGKIFSESQGEIQRAVDETRFMAGEASRLEGHHFPSERSDVQVVRMRVPMGPVGVITPWNFPVVSPVRKISPALACGDTVVFKPASLTPWTGLRLGELYAEAGVPAGVVNVVLGSGSIVGRAIAESPRIKGITFTGSTDVGRSLYQSSAYNLIKIQLEMGGKNPALVFDAEDLRDAAKNIVTAAFASSGQRCTAISRVIVSRREHDELVAAMTDLIGAMTVGDGMDPQTGIGPLVSEEQLQTAEKYMAIAGQEAAEIMIGGKRAERVKEGYFFEPTLITRVKPDSPLARDEIFGPILPVLVVDSAEEGIEMCNDTPYGLAGCVFTKYLKVTRLYEERVEAGMIHVNHGTASQAHVPFGGVKQSGFGAYSIGLTAKDFYMNEKIVYTK